jgi:ABC-type branched-subunit amino acid transport system ATPase component
VRFAVSRASSTPTSWVNGMSDEPLCLTVTNVAAGYGGAPIISGVSASVCAGEIVSILGPNGAGKSTLLKALVGVVRVIEGSVKLGDRDVTNLPTDELARSGMGYVPQINDVFTALTVRENLEMGGYLLEASSIGRRIDEVVEMFPTIRRVLGSRAGKLSGGERKMLAMARVLMLDPHVLVLDEPTANLSPDLATKLLKEYVRRLADAGKAVLLVEQRAAAALEISDRAHVLVSGRVKLSGSSSELLAMEDFAEVFLGRQSYSAPVEQLS